MVESDCSPEVYPSIEEIEAEVLRLGMTYPNTVYVSPATGIFKISGINFGNSCYYLKGDAGPGQGCIFGQALQNLGVSKKFLEGQEGRGIEGVVKPWLVAPVYWEDIQIAQDIGLSWKEVVHPLVERSRSSSRGKTAK